MSAVEEVMKHFGVKGMHWGTVKGRKAKEPPSSDASKARAIRDRAKKGKVKVLSNAELQDAINRMNLEQQFKRLSVNEQPAVRRWMSSTLLEIGKREVQVGIAKKVGKVAAKAVG